MRIVPPDPSDQLDGFDDQLWLEIIERGVVVSYNRGERLSEIGDVDDHVAYVLSGEIDLLVKVNGEERRSGITKLRGETISSASMHLQSRKFFAPIVRTATARVLKVPRESVYDICQSNRRFLELTLRDISSQFIGVVADVVMDRSRTSEQRVADRLCELWTQHQSIPCTQSELATLVGMSRVTISKCLAELEDRKLITRDRGHILVLDFENLKTLADPNVL